MDANDKGSRRRGRGRGPPCPGPRRREQAPGPRRGRASRAHTQMTWSWTATSAGRRLDGRGSQPYRHGRVRGVHMSDQSVLLDQVRRYWEYVGKDEARAHEIYHGDAVLEFPQSGERFEGVANFREWRRRYPADLRFRIRRLTARE